MEPRRHKIWPCLVGMAGYHITAQPGSTASWDLRVDALNGDAVTVDGISLAEAQAFISCLQKMLIHFAPGQPAAGAMTIDEIRASAGLPGRSDPPPAAGETPEDPSGAPRTDPPSTGPQPAAAQEPYATGGWVPPHAQLMVISAGDCVLPSAWLEGPWPTAAASSGPQFEIRFDQTAPRPHGWPQVVHLKPGEVINVTCSCQTIAGGTLADNPNCPMHHGASTVYVFDGR